MRRSTKISRSIFRSGLIAVVLALVLSNVSFLGNASASTNLDNNLCTGGACLFAHITGDTSNITVVAQNQNASLSSWNFKLKPLSKITGGDVWGAGQDVTGDHVCPCQTLTNPKDPSGKYTIYVTRNGVRITDFYPTAATFNFLNSPIPTINVPSGTKPVQSTVLKGTIDVQGSDGKTVAARTWSGARTLPAVELKASDGTVFDQATLGSNGTFNISLKPGTYTGSFDIQNPNDSTLDAQFTIPNIQVTAGPNNTIAIHVKQPQSGQWTYTANGTTAANKHYSVTGSGPGAPPPPSSKSGSTTPDKATCDSSGLSLSWFVCPIINGLADASDSIFNSFIVPFLQTNVIAINNPQDPIFQAWSSFRNIANVLLIVFLLVAVISEAAGGGLLDAYTVKKMMPRLLIAAILINLSIYLAAGLVDIFNIAGNGIRDLILAPFHQNGNQLLNIKPNVGASGLGIAAIVGGAFAAFIGGTAFLSFLFLFVLLPAFLAMIGVFLTLIIRQGLIVFLVIISPVAFTLYALPNTEKYFKKWWEELTKALLMYPIIVAIFAMAQVMAGLLSNENQTSGLRATLADVASMMIMVLALGAVPFAFKFASSVLTNTAATLAGWGKKAHQGILGNPNMEHSLRNRTKRNLGERYTRAQDQLVRSGRGVTASDLAGMNRRQRLGARGRMLLGGAASRFGNVDARMSRYQDAANKQAEMMSATGRDALRYAGAGYSLAAGEVDSSGTTAGHRRYFNSKGEEISRNLYSEGKRLYGANKSDIASGLEYTVRKAKTDKDLGNYRFALAKNAVEHNWDQAQTMDVHSAAVFPHKDKFIDEWYSAPEVQQSGGRTTGMSWKEVTEDPEAARNMINEVHKANPNFKNANLRDNFWRALYDQQQRAQTRMESGNYTAQDLQDYAQADEILEGMVHQGMLTQDDTGNYSVTGVTAAAQGVILAAAKNRRYYTESVSNGPGGGEAADWRQFAARGADGRRSGAPGAAGAVIPAVVQVTGGRDRGEIKDISGRA